MLLELENVKCFYDGVEGLKGISMRLEEGEIACLLGANGAGKTTTLRAISGLHKPTSGQIRFHGERIDGASPNKIVAWGIAQVPERGRVFRSMTTYENLIMGAYRRKDKSGISRDLEMVYHYFPILKERAGQKAQSLSGGIQQMLAIGRALMGKPRLLLLDEPSLGLSPKTVILIKKIMDEINKSGISILLAEQNAWMALSVAQKGFVMETGKIVLERDSKALLNDEIVRKAYLGG
jgi:branched-chain amino acid transport system ATP-binding protein